MSQPLNRVPPSDLDAEQSVLGSLLLNPRKLEELAQWLRPADFYRENHGKVYEACLNLMLRREPIDSITVADELDRMKRLDSIGGRAQLMLLMESVPTAENASHYAHIVKDHAKRRRLLEIAGAGIAKAHDEGIGIDESLSWVQGEAFAVLAEGQKRDWQRPSGLLRTAMDRLEAARKQNGVVGLSSGFYDLDRLTGGFRDSDLVIVCGRPSMGKTAFAIGIALNLALTGMPVAIFSLEMSSELLIERLLATVAKVNATGIRNGRLTDSDQEKVYAAMGPLGDAPLFIDETSVFTHTALLARAQEIKRRENIGLIVVDYLQLMQGVDSRNRNREQEVASIARGLKQVALALKVPVIAVSQLSRAPDGRKGDDKRPTLADLRESGEIEQSADTVLGLYRANYYDPSSRPGQCEAILLKQRNGPIGTVNLMWNPQQTRFGNLASKQYEEV